MCVSGGKKCLFLGNFPYVLNNWSRMRREQNNKKNVITKKIFALRSVFKNLLDIYDGIFRENS